MADYSNIMLATVTSLQKRQKPPKIIYQRALLSNLYPYFYEEAISGAVAFAGGILRKVLPPQVQPAEIISGSATFAGGELIQLGPIEYTIQPEQITGSAVFASGELKTVVINQAQPAEIISGSATFAGGELKVVVVSYDNYEPETVIGSATFAGGSLEIV